MTQVCFDLSVDQACIVRTNHLQVTLTYATTQLQSNSKKKIIIEHTMQYLHQKSYFRRVIVQFTYIHPILNEVPYPESIDHLKFWVNLRIYHRKNETFLVSKSFFWRRRHHDNNGASLLKVHRIPLFSLWELWSV